MAKDKTPRELVQELYETRKDATTTHNQIVQAIAHNQSKQDYAPLVEQRDQFLEQEQSIRGALKELNESSDGYYCGLCGKMMPISSFPHPH